MSGKVVTMTGEQLEQAAAEAKRLMEESCVEASIKKIRSDMTKLLSTLGDANLPALEAVGALLNSATLAAMDVITMAAEMKRAMTDLYAAERCEPAPLEELAESGGFEEAEDLESMDIDNDFDEEDE